MKSYDVIIVGAGPAGAVAGFLCAESGLKTLVLEKKRLPRPKSCGGGITANAIALLKRIDCFDADWFDSFVNQFMIHLPKTGRAYALAAKSPCMGIVRRDYFDLALIKKAQGQGAELKTGEVFCGFRQTGRKMLEVATDQAVFKARALIGADGYHSRVRKQLERKRYGTTGGMPGLMGIEGDLPAESVDALSTDCCHLFFDFAPGVSYGWMFPRGRQLNAGLLINAPGRNRYPGGKSPNQLIDEFAENILKTRSPWRRRAGAGIPLQKLGQKPLLQRGNVLLAGDAAGLADAWTGEGIYYAIKSAVLAHQAIRNRFDENKAIPTPDYNQLCRQEILNELHLAYLFFIFFRRFPRAYHLLAHERIRRLFLPYIKGELSYPKAFAKALGHGLGYKFRLSKDNC